MRFALGTRVQVQVSRVDLDGRRIDFRLVPDGDAGLRLNKESDSAQPPSSERVDNAEFSGRRSRNISDPLSRAPRAKGAAVKTPSKSTGAKVKEKSRKSRRRT
jgi:ribonuclease R